ncbi:hypothetical protein AC1031_009172 [Aphanomyces cochlioides]|nr:hypothetical protein AC1031_009172 [Aphanomyces cochlioides]
MDMRARLDAWKEKKRKLEVETTSKIQEGGRRVKRAVMSTLPTRTVQPRSISAPIVHTSKISQPKVVVSRSNSSQQASNPSLPSRVEVARRSKNGHLESPQVSPTPDKDLTHSSSSISSDIPNATDEHQASPNTSAHELKKTASMTNLGAPLRILNRKRTSNEVLLDKFDSPTQPPRRVSMGDPPSTAKKTKENRRASYEVTPSKRRSSLSSGPLRVLANQSESDSDDDIMPDQPTDRRTSSTLQALRVRTSTSRLSTSSLRTSIEPVERDKTAKWSRDDFKSIEKKLGFGKFGYVYLTKQKTVAEKEVALKVLTKNNMDEVRVRGLKMEVEIQSRLKHPHILRLYRYFHEEALAYLVLEYAPHGTLQKLLEEQSEGYFPEDKAAKFVAQVAKALQYLHARHVIHRDIKVRLLNSNDSAVLTNKILSLKTYSWGQSTISK